MFPGFFIGTVFLFLLMRTLIWGPRHRFHRYHAGYHPWGGRGDGPPWSWHDFRARNRRGWRDMDRDAGGDREVDSHDDDAPFSTRGRVDEAIDQFVRSLRNRLRATPPQQRAFEAAVARLRDATQRFQAGMNEARDDLARAMRADTFDELAFEAASLRLDEIIERMRAVVRETLVNVHDVLDARQRTILGNLMESRRIVDI